MQSLRSAMIARVRRPVAARRSVSEAPAAAVPPRMQVGVVNQAVSRLRTVGLGFLGGVVAAFAVYEYWKKPAAAAAAGHSATALDAETKNTAKQVGSPEGARPVKRGVQDGLYRMMGWLQEFCGNHSDKQLQSKSATRTRKQLLLKS